MKGRDSPKAAWATGIMQPGWMGRGDSAAMESHGRCGVASGTAHTE
jgi:hypothetical protein